MLYDDYVWWRRWQNVLYWWFQLSRREKFTCSIVRALNCFVGKTLQWLLICVSIWFRNVYATLHDFGLLFSPWVGVTIHVQRAYIEFMRGPGPSTCNKKKKPPFCVVWIKKFNEIKWFSCKSLTRPHILLRSMQTPRLFIHSPHSHTTFPWQPLKRFHVQRAHPTVLATFCSLDIQGVNFLWIYRHHMYSLHKQQILRRNGKKISKAITELVYQFVWFK